MQHQNVEQTVKQIIADQIRKLKVENVKNEDTLESLGADSLDSVEIILGIENAFKVTINESDFENLRSVQSLIDFVQAK
jgi:acyl carrier protein